MYKIALSILYKLFITPVGKWSRRNRDPFLVKEDAGGDGQHTSLWLERSSSDKTIRDARRQY